MIDLDTEMKRIEDEFGPERTLQKWKAEAAVLKQEQEERSEKLAQAYDKMPVVSDAERAEAAARVAGRK